jgi:hypothetical protein
LWSGPPVFDEPQAGRYHETWLAEPMDRSAGSESSQESSGAETFMLQGLSTLARRLLQNLQPSNALASPTLAAVSEDSGPDTAPLEKLKRVVLTDGVGRTLFEDFARHQASDRGHEETGWILLGLRREAEAIVLATLPAGTKRDAGATHVRFDKDAQMVGSRLLRQYERRLRMLGVVHTHPGTLRHPSPGDFQGDSRWVRQLRGLEGVFGIGTVEKDKIVPEWLVERTRPHVHRQANRRFSWYVLGALDKSYRKIPAEYTLGPDLGRPAHSVWSTLEQHAPAIERICRQQARVTLEVRGQEQTDLKLKIPLAEPGDLIEIEIVADKAAYVVQVGGEQHLVDPKAEGIERGLYMILAELANRAIPG